MVPELGTARPGVKAPNGAAAGRFTRREEAPPPLPRGSGRAGGVLPCAAVPPARPPRRRPLARIALVAAALLGLGVAALVALWLLLPDPAAWRGRNPPTTALIEQRKVEAAKAKRRYRPQQAWVPLERISRRLVEAVVASEDAKFFAHRGFDWEALEAAARHDLARGRFARGASTISQQLAKNLWLGTEKSLLRKAKEALLTARLERALDKRRILAIYLNVAEWGDGVFGVEAGARRHLGASAASLSTAQAVLLASMLPAPRRVDLSRPSGWLRGRAGHLLGRLRDEHAISGEEYREAKAELDRLLRGPASPGEAEEPPEDDDPPASAPASIAGPAAGSAGDAPGDAGAPPEPPAGGGDAEVKAPAPPGSRPRRPPRRRPRRRTSR